MPQEFSRTTKRKRIQVMDSYVDVPVITAISFIDQFSRYQEYQISINNGSRAVRETRVDRVYHVDENGAADPANYLDVERIKYWTTIDKHSRYQEVRHQFDNETGKDDLPPHFRTHLTTHTVKYRNPDTPEDIWIESELIDSFSVIDPHDRYQETVYTLKNPQTDAAAQANPEDEDITDRGDNELLDPPWRLDPFQNIVNVSSAMHTGVLLISSAGGAFLRARSTMPAEQSTGVGYLEWELTGSGTQSYSGIAWSPLDHLFACVKYGGADLGGGRTGQIILTSEDGYTFTEAATIEPPAPWALVTMFDVAWGETVPAQDNPTAPAQGFFFTLANREKDGHAGSSDGGVTWEPVQDPPDAPDPDPFSPFTHQRVIYCKELTKFVATGWSDTEAEGGGNGAYAVMVSSNGTDWRYVSQHFPGITLHGICWSRELGLFVACRVDPAPQPAQLYTSEDGENWTAVSVPAPSSAGWWAVCWGANCPHDFIDTAHPGDDKRGRFVAVADLSADDTSLYGSIYSDDGKTWLAGNPFPHGASPRNITYVYPLRQAEPTTDNPDAYETFGLFIVVAQDFPVSHHQVIFSSRDGINWIIEQTFANNCGDGGMVWAYPYDEPTA